MEAEFDKNKDIYIKNYSNIGKEYKIYFKKVESDIDKLTFDKDFYISNLKEKDGYFFVTMNKISPLDESTINYSTLKIHIIKNFSESNKSQKKVDIEIKKEKKISKKDFQNLKFLNYDFLKVNDNICFLFVLLLNKFYLFKIYDNPNKDSLDYTRLKFENNKSNNKYLYLGNKKYNNNL
jgi:hypothetical protein